MPLLLISPYARTHFVAHEAGDHGSAVKFADVLFGQENWGPDDALTPGVSDLTRAFDPARLSGEAAPLPASYAIIPDAVVNVLPQQSGYGLKEIGVTPADVRLGLPNPIPLDFNPRPRTNPGE